MAHHKLFVTLAFTLPERSVITDAGIVALRDKFSAVASLVPGLPPAEVSIHNLPPDGSEAHAYARRLRQEGVHETDFDFDERAAEDFSAGYARGRIEGRAYSAPAAPAEQAAPRELGEPTPHASDAELIDGLAIALEEAGWLATVEPSIPIALDESILWEVRGIKSDLDLPDLVGERFPEQLTAWCDAAIRATTLLLDHGVVGHGEGQAERIQRLEAALAKVREVRPEAVFPSKRGIPAAPSAPATPPAEPAAPPASSECPDLSSARACGEYLDRCLVVLRARGWLDSTTAAPKGIGRTVREIHTAWLNKQPRMWHGKSLDFDALLEGERDVYTRIGETLWGLGFDAAIAHMSTLRREALDADFSRALTLALVKIEERIVRLRKRRPRAWRRRIAELQRLHAGLSQALPANQQGGF